MRIMFFTMWFRSYGLRYLSYKMFFLLYLQAHKEPHDVQNRNFWDFLGQGQQANNFYLSSGI